MALYGNSNTPRPPTCHNMQSHIYFSIYFHQIPDNNTVMEVTGHITFLIGLESDILETTHIFIASRKFFPRLQSNSGKGCSSPPPLSFMPLAVTHKKKISSGGFTLQLHKMAQFPIRRFVTVSYFTPRRASWLCFEGDRRCWVGSLALHYAARLWVRQWGAGAAGRHRQNAAAQGGET